MPRYYFRLTDGIHQCSDCDALDLPDDEAARKEAELEAYDLLDPGEGDWGNWTIRVSDKMGRHVTSVLINDVRKRSHSGLDSSSGLTDSPID
jgi:Domain of unknown function (DUF6894)